MLFDVENVVVIDNKIYYFLRKLRVLFVYDIESNKIIHYSSFPGDNRYDLTDGIKMFYWNGYIVFTPIGKKLAWKYNISEDEWTSINVPVEGIGWTHRQLFVSAVYKDYLYMMGCINPFIFKVNLNTNEVKVLKYNEKMNDEEKPFCDRFRCCIRDGHLVIPSVKNDYFYDINMSSEDIELEIIKNCEEYTNKKASGVYVDKHVRKTVCDKYCILIDTENGLSVNMNERDCSIAKSTIKESVFDYLKNNQNEMTKIFVEDREFQLEDFIQIIS